MADEKTEFENHIIPCTRGIYASHPNEVICGEHKNSEVCEMKLFEQRFQNEFTWAENILGPHSYVRRFIQIVLECISNVQTFARGTNKHLRFSFRVIVAFRHKKLSAWTRFTHERPQRVSDSFILQRLPQFGRVTSNYFAFDTPAWPICRKSLAFLKCSCSR